MALVLGAAAVFWVVFWWRGRSGKRPRILLLLKLCSDALLVAFFAGLFVWKWPPTVIVAVGFALALSFAARLIAAAVGLVARGHPGGQ